MSKANMTLTVNGTNITEEFLVLDTYSLYTLIDLGDPFI
jgi:hypothetical protein